MMMLWQRSMHFRRYWPFVWESSALDSRREENVEWWFFLWSWLTVEYAVHLLVIWYAMMCWSFHYIFVALEKQNDTQYGAIT